MRIRSIKPEFWTSEDIAALDWQTRLLFIGLWSYVDDNGVGRDVEKLIVADLFPLEDDPRDTLATVSRGLATLSDAGLIERYEVDGKPYLHIVTWADHQRIDKPGKTRYPLPTCGNAVPRDSHATPSRQSRETPAPGAGEQGSRGAGEVPPTAGREATAQTLISEWVDHCGTRPPNRVVGQISKEVGQMLKEGIPYPDVRAGLAAWHDKRLHPSALASVVHEVRTGPATSRRLSTTDQRVNGALALAAEFATEPRSIR